MNMAPLSIEIPLESIVIGKRRRALNRARVPALAESIRSAGLIHPVVVRKGTRELVAGRHRIEAFRVLGREDIPVHYVDATDPIVQLMEIDENLQREELSTLERMEHLAARKAIYEEMHPDATRQGGDRQSPQRGLCSPSFVADTVEKTGRGRSTVLEEVSIANGIAPEVRARIHGTATADSKQDLRKLARLDPEQQAAAVAMVASGEARNVRTAAKKIAHPHEAYFTEEDVTRALFRDVDAWVARFGLGLAPMVERWLQTGLPVLEPCAGAGHIVHVLRELGAEVVTGDINPKYDTDRVGNYLHWGRTIKPGEFAATVSNPPFTLSDDVALIATQTTPRVALLLNLTWSEPCMDRRVLWLSEAIGKVFEARPPNLIMAMNPRVPFDGTGNAPTTTMWTVWDPDLDPFTPYGSVSVPIVDWPREQEDDA